VKNLTWQNPEQLFVAQVLIKKVKLKCCGIKVVPDSSANYRYIQVSKENDLKKMNDLAECSIAQNNTSIQKIDYDRFLVDFCINLNTIDYYESEIYLSPKGSPVIVLPRIVVSLQDGFNISQILDVLGDQAVVESSGKNRYILSCEVNKSSEVLQMIQKMASLDGINYYEPEMYLDCHLGNTYYSEQYYNTIYITIHQAASI